MEEENCPYCAVYLGPAPDESGASKDILAPPYRLVETEENEEEPAAEPSSGKEKAISFSLMQGDLREVLVPLSFLSMGALFFLFGLVLYFFSEEGVFTLSWNAEHWYVYFSTAIPLLLFGWRALSRFDNEEEDL